MLDSRFNAHTTGTCNSEAVVSGKSYRFTVLTDRMLRLEYSEDGVFEDRATQVVWNRSFPVPHYSVAETEESLEIDTAFFHLYYDKKGFSANHLYIDPKYAFTNYGGRWYFGRKTYGDPPREHNLKGTARTLDRCNGSSFQTGSTMDHIPVWGTYEDRNGNNVDLGMGLCDSSGRSFFDDSSSLVLDEDGWVHSRKKDIIDIYFFCYGRDYFGCIHDYYLLTGSIPMLPRYALGNWWSRYWKYTEKTYKQLFERFEETGVPFSMCVMDMDWHLVDIPEKYGRGWTGFTWNKELFPNPEGLMEWLHSHNYHVVLNLHPADGVRGFEEKYHEIAEDMGIDPETDYPVHFDFTDQEFINTYFNKLLHPLESQGVDFWWIDWQQGSISPVEGLDPLWLLNHFHHLDSRRLERRGLILSRYAGLGSHRYPIGFSGDTHMTWESLQFQPYFTATAANVGYSWWSHDIGGFMAGIKDYQLYVRWLQLGVFSPINRLHTGSNPFGGKEPWRYPSPYCEIICETLRLRHKMLPYIYTMNYVCSEKKRPFIVPVYYNYPMDKNAYAFPNEYFFGSELLVQPMVHSVDSETGYCTEKAWLPPGTWTDLFTGLTYDGAETGKRIYLSRPVNRQCVLAKAGAIVPMCEMTNDLNSLSNPDTIDIFVFPGASNAFELFEDCGDGSGYLEGVRVITKISLKWSENDASLEIKPSGDFSILPDKRGYRIHFRGFNNIRDITASEPVSGSYSKMNRTFTVSTDAASPDRTLTVNVSGNLKYDRNDITDHVFSFLDEIQGSIPLKREIFEHISKNKEVRNSLSGLLGMNLPDSWEKVLTEMLLG